MDNQLIYGTYRLPKTFNEFKEIIEKLYKSKINIIDTATCYNKGLSEKWLGEIDNKNLVISTKVGKDYDKSGKLVINLDEKIVLEQTFRSLRRLKIKTIPFLFLHDHDKNVKISEIENLIKKIKSLNLAKNIGLSNFPFKVSKKLVDKGLIDVVQIKIGSDIKRKIMYYNKKNVEIWLYRPFSKGKILKKQNPKEIICSILKRYENIKIIFGTSNVDQLNWIQKNG